MANDSSTQSVPDQHRTSTATIILMVALAVYWAALFYSTHMRIPQGMLPGNSDKVVHFAAYGGLGALMMALRAARGAFTWTSVIVRWLILAAYGVFDELTQLLVNRNADIRDWLYDITGAAAGLLLVTFAVWCFRPKIR